MQILFKKDETCVEFADKCYYKVQFQKGAKELHGYNMLIAMKYAVIAYYKLHEKIY